jgi:hypothetical protein
MRQVPPGGAKTGLENAAGGSNLLRVRELTPGLRAGETFILSASDMKAA